LQPLLPRNAVLAYCALLLAVGVAWGNSLGGGAVFDDHWLVVGNPCFRSWDGLVRTLSFLSTDHCAYRPMRYLSYGVDRLLLGDHLWAYHLGNVVRHGLFAVVAGLLATGLFADARGLGRPDRRAWVAGFVVAAIWALHPVQTDSVSYMSGRRDVLVGGWSLTTLALARVATRRGGLWWLAPLWTLLFALLSKENAVVVPAIFGLWLLRDRSPLEVLRRYRAPLVALTLGGALALVLFVQRALVDSHSHRGLLDWWGGSPASNFATVAALQLQYLRLVLTGGPLIGDYHAETIPLAAGFGDVRALGGIAAVVLLLAAGLGLRRRAPEVAFGCLFYLVALAPMSHVIPHHELFAEHYLYLPLFGLALAAVGVADRAAGNLFEASRPADLLADARLVAVAFVTGLLLLVFAGAVAVRNEAWSDERTFYEQVIVRAPGNQRALGNLLYIYAEAREWEAALTMCAAMAPQWVPGATQERTALARCTEVARALDRPDAIGAFARQLAAHHPDFALGWRRLAEVALHERRYPDAVAAARRWWELARAPAAVFVGAQAAASDPAVPIEAVQALEAAADTTPGVELGAHVQIALALLRRGAATEAWTRLSAHEPPQPDAGYLAMLCAAAEAAGEAPPPACATQPR
jgi:tetratricopeptide (TPR) repeat protein